MIEIRCDEKWENLINKSELQKILTIFLKYLYAGERGISLYIANDADDPGMFEAQMSEAELENSESTGVAGELVISGERVSQQATENGWDFETELFRLLAHGCAHLAGWNHERSSEEASEMLELESELLKKVGLTNIY
jgi:rRNA maturation RNase YbeY